MRVLLTGFEPFGKYKENSSWAVAEKVAACGVCNANVMARRLPVSFAGVAKALRDAVEECNPDVVVMLGQSANIDYVKLERIAINMMDSALADNDGYTADEEPISMDGVAALFTNVDVKQLCKTLIKENINAKVSNSAGLFVCNRLYYEALLMCKENPGMKALFVHLPLYEGQSSAENEKPCMPLDDMVKAIQIITRKIYDTSTKFQETACAHFRQ